MTYFEPMYALAILTCGNRHAIDGFVEPALIRLLQSERIVQLLAALFAA